MENIKVSYNENWDFEGYHTTQNIRMSKDLLKKFNEYITVIREPIKKKSLVTSAEMDLICFGGNVIDLGKCLTHTQLMLLYDFLRSEGIDCSRIKVDRNTMLVMA